MSKKIRSMYVMSCHPTPQQHEPTLRSMSKPHHVSVLCDSCEHMVRSCHNLPFVKAKQHNALNSCGNFRKPTVNTFSQTYHPDNRFHPDFSYHQAEAIQSHRGLPEFQSQYPRQQYQQPAQTNHLMVLHPQQPIQENHFDQEH